MATAPTPTAAPSAEEFAALQLRVTALEEFLAQLATVLECEPRGFTAERMNHWLNICTAKMITTGSAKPEEVAALRRLQGIVVG
ncbi:hypothetical protein B5M06_13425 [Comamonas kerstersii]|uniref:Uncharacterized protein n=1 Tax=Comamonas kerstersii TaxID=225992 RepID=A0A0W7YS78_9BURK|nr:hypothetical protein [Comamonas kerstersii]AQZ99108.1 hypothetical protein B5M06_13425 [Comamonas kerstersii]KUF37942.1 hypothetical protein AS359_04320 [Comamonas kerstersii]